MESRDIRSDQTYEMALMSGPLLVKGPPVERTFWPWINMGYE